MALVKAKEKLEESPVLMTEGIEAVNEIKSFLDKVKPDLTINRVPKPTLELFKKFAEEEFCSDYGFTLKFLLDFYFGRLVDGSRIAEAKADEALSQLAELKEQPKVRKIKTLDGKEHEVKRNE
jgi:hypothetical protein